MKPGALLINTAAVVWWMKHPRRALRHQADRRRRLRRAERGTTRDNPFAHDFAGRGNPSSSPHVAWVSREAMRALADQLIGNIEAFAAGGGAQPGSVRR